MSDTKKYEGNIKALEQMSRDAARDGQELADQVGEIFQPVVDQVNIIIDPEVAARFRAHFNQTKGKLKKDFDATLAIIPEAAEAEAARTQAGLNEAKKGG